MIYLYCNIDENITKSNLPTNTISTAAKILIPLGLILPLYLIFRNTAPSKTHTKKREHVYQIHIKTPSNPQKESVVENKTNAFSSLLNDTFSDIKTQVAQFIQNIPIIGPHISKDNKLVQEIIIHFINSIDIDILADISTIISLMEAPLVRATEIYTSFNQFAQYLKTSMLSHVTSVVQQLSNGDNTRIIIKQKVLKEVSATTANPGKRVCNFSGIAKNILNAYHIKNEAHDKMLEFIHLRQIENFAIACFCDGIDHLYDTTNDEQNTKELHQFVELLCKFIIRIISAIFKVKFNKYTKPDKNIDSLSISFVNGTLEYVPKYTTTRDFLWNLHELFCRVNNNQQNT